MVLFVMFVVNVVSMFECYGLVVLVCVMRMVVVMLVVKLDV